jgi:hypothetical protein
VDSEDRIYANKIYNLLFYDDWVVLAPKGDKPPVAWEQVVFSEPADTGVLRALADDTSQEGRVRYLAFTKLRQQKEAVPPKVLLGVIVRMSFLVSDGLHFGEGPWSVMESDPMAAPIIQRAAQLLVAVVDLDEKYGDKKGAQEPHQP